MGWSDYVIVEKLRLVVEISRYVTELDDWIKESLDFLIDEENDTIEISEIKVTNLSLKELAVLVMNYDKASPLSGMDYNKLFLYWLKCRGIDYEIESEYSIKLEEYEEKGYLIIRRDYT